MARMYVLQNITPETMEELVGKEIAVKFLEVDEVRPRRICHMNRGIPYRLFALSIILQNWTFHGQKRNHSCSIQAGIRCSRSECLYASMSQGGIPGTCAWSMLIHLWCPFVHYAGG